MAEATNANDELYPIAVLIDELKVGRSEGPTAVLAHAFFCFGCIPLPTSTN